MTDPKCASWDIDRPLLAIADRIARDWLPDTGPCGVCGDTETGARHRVADAIVEFVITEMENTNKKTDCICERFRDAGGYRIADLKCPVHGVGGTDPGDGYWKDGE